MSENTPITIAAVPTHRGRSRVRILALAAVLAGLAVGGFFGWRWLQDWNERQEALELANHGRFDEAEPRLQQIYERHPDDVEVVRALALGHFGAKHVRETGTYLNRWCELRPADPQPFRERLEYWMKRRRVAEALADVEHILELEPGDAALHRERARLLLLTGNDKAAEALCLRRLQIEPENLELRFLLASVYHRQGKAPESIAFVDGVLEARPEFFSGLLLRAELYLEANQPKEAVPLLRRATDLSRKNNTSAKGPDDMRALYLLSQALSRTGEEAEAKKALREWRIYDTMNTWLNDGHRYDNLEMQRRVVDALVDDGQPDEAVHFLKRILQDRPEALAPHRLLAEYYEKHGQPLLAAEHRRLAQPTP